MLFIRLLKESFLFAYQSVVVNKLRTILSLLGITIGIFAIISVFTVIDSLERGVRNSISSLGNDVIYIQKWPWAFGGDYPWWKYMNRPVPNLKDYESLKKRSTKAEAVSFVVSTQQSVSFNRNSTDRSAIVAHTQEFSQIRNIEIIRGRYFSDFEANSGKPIAIIGNTIAEELFGNDNPVGKNIKVAGQRLTVIGLLKKEGSNDLGGGGSFDEVVLVPINYVRNLINLRSDRLDPFIMVKAKDNVPIAELKDELRSIMRSVRRLKPMEEDDFALNQSSLLNQGVESIFTAIDLAGWIIGGFSILVGGFGIANIMFVSVKERTNIIGIQKSLGAKKYFILFQFLSESVILSITGGAIGLLIIFVGSKFASNATDLNFALTSGNIVLGLTISFIIGVVSGFAPAYTASKLNPVDAINTVV